MIGDFAIFAPPIERVRMVRTQVFNQADDV
jgi:hypothetical protein